LNVWNCFSVVVIAATIEAGRGGLTQGNDGTCGRSVSSSDSFRVISTEQRSVGLQVP
jgi:hypothetical protein